MLFDGGFIVTPNIRHIVDGDDMSGDIIRAHMSPLIGFLFADELITMRIEDMNDIKSFTAMAMTNRRAVENSLVQIPVVAAPIRRGRRRFNAFL